MKKHILIFDSGLGGTTVLEEIARRIPSSTYSYVMDNGAFPYGDKPNSYLESRAIRLFSRLIPISQPDLVVIACNTASTLFLDTLRQQFDIPFVGVVPAIKPAAQITQSGVIGLLATKATISRTYIENLHRQHAPDCTLAKLDGQALVTLAEQKMIYGESLQSSIDDVVKEIASKSNLLSIDTIVLGCTHFPAIREELINGWPRTCQWLDSGAAIARRVETLLPQCAETTHHAEILFTTAPLIEWHQLLPLLRRYGISHHQTIAID
ncbi:Glutamate racemase [BD1-7 clade bacterium]|uniref:Glutamate racemase n=1 Tax=BD1-7 clade bacterium TaxID=2029982 RepID=A0A5S9QMH2_9GAMM|nr:Glutamate racemase [BD1-7 clade bacterium]